MSRTHIESVSKRCLLEPNGLNWVQKTEGEWMAEGFWPGSENWHERPTSQYMGGIPAKGARRWW